MELIISLISGAVGGNLAGGVLKNFNMGPLWNSVLGIIGGGLGGQLMGLVGADAVTDAAGAVGGLDIGSILTQVASGGVGGGARLAIVGVVRNQMGK